VRKAPSIQQLTDAKIQVDEWEPDEQRERLAITRISKNRSPALLPYANSPLVRDTLLDIRCGVIELGDLQGTLQPPATTV
jgi:hypothetical protein